MSDAVEKKKLSREEKIKEENRKRIEIVAKELKDNEFRAIEDDVEAYLNTLTSLDTWKAKIIARIEDYKHAQGYFIPTKFSYNPGHIKVDRERAKALAIAEGINPDAFLKEVKSYRLDEKAFEQHLKDMGLVVPYTHTAGSFFVKTVKSDSDSDGETE